MILLQEPIR